MFTEQPQEGLKMLQDALNIYTQIGAIPSQANIYFFLGQILASSGQKEEAIEMLEQAVSLGSSIDPNHPVTKHMQNFLNDIRTQLAQ